MLYKKPPGSTVIHSPKYRPGGDKVPGPYLFPLYPLVFLLLVIGLVILIEFLVIPVAMPALWLS